MRESIDIINLCKIKIFFVKSESNKIVKYIFIWFAKL